MRAWASARKSGKPCWPETSADPSLPPDCLPNRYELAVLLRRLAHEERKCILFSTHDLDIALSLCDAVALIDTPQLHLLPADEMIRSGCIERLFAGENACFDAATRTVRLR